MRRIAALTCAVALFAACGGDDKKSSSTQAPNGTDATDSSTEGTAVDTTDAATTTTILVTTTTTAPEMPDVVDDTLSDAKDELAALGVDDVRVSEVEHISKPGTVLDQVPSAGNDINGPVDLTVSKALAPMPDWTTKLIAEARKYFDERGVKITIEDALDDTVVEGTIIASTPSAGQTISSEVRLRVAKTPVTKFLAETEVVEQSTSCGSEVRAGDVGVNGATQLRSIYSSGNSFNQNSPCSYDYNLGRDWVRLKGGIGIADTSNSDLQCRFEVFVDGNSVFNQTIPFGQLLPLDLDMTNVLRLHLVVTPTTSRTAGQCVWAGIRLIGDGTTN